ncbi:hypothetical protein MmTuc01_0599 [Methanosarcina mazei Tuc01]|uniref:Mobile element protein n=1 Tax=Methanosarcina mazei Tuc01 TaxID=1236903 RepID=M1P6K3_METMZ|nr:hypothetical protein MmTuc01_0599 [Methanosarcina mazei Tuc01]
MFNKIRQASTGTCISGNTASIQIKNHTGQCLITISRKYHYLEKAERYHI